MIDKPPRFNDAGLQQAAEQVRQRAADHVLLMDRMSADIKEAERLLDEAGIREEVTFAHLRWCRYDANRWRIVYVPHDGPLDREGDRQPRPFIETKVAIRRENFPALAGLILRALP